MARARKAQAERMAARICRRIDELAKISESPDGITRIAFSREHRRAADLLLTYMAEAGMSVRMDEIGNVIGRYEGERDGLPALMVGSHYDTVRDAGRWDGPLGVLTAIECVAEIAASGVRLPYAIEVIGFADEEGVRFSSTLLGSRAVAGTFDDGALEARDANGISTRAALEAFGLDPSHIRRAARRRQDVLAYLDRIPVCVAYRLDGCETKEFPTGAALQRAEPVIAYLPGFGRDISACRSWEDLPPAARDYVRYLELELGSPIKYVSVGAAREEIIVR